MENRLKKSYSGVISQVTQAINGVSKYGAELSLLWVHAETMQNDLDAFIAAEERVVECKTELAKCRKRLLSAGAEARRFAFLARDIIKPHLGQQYSPSWEEAGFRGSLRVPRENPQLLALMLSFDAYFRAHPAHANAILHATSERAVALYGALTGGRTAVNQGITAMQQAIKMRDAAGARLRLHLRGLIKELSLRLAPLDERWDAFGLNKPGHQPTPDAPVEVNTDTNHPEVTSLKIGKTARAKSFRVWKRAKGSESEPELVKSSRERHILLEGIPTDGTVEISVSASNDAGESPRSTWVLLRRQAAKPRGKDDFHVVPDFFRKPPWLRFPSNHTRFKMDPDPGRKTPAHGVRIELGTPTRVFVTVNAQDRIPWIAQCEVQASLQSIWSKADAWLVTHYVLMPDHLHFICAPRDLRFTIERWNKYWKSEFSRAHLDKDWEWQRDAFHYRLRTADEATEKYHYMRQNPVRKGLVANADEWPFRGVIHHLPAW